MPKSTTLNFTQNLNIVSVTFGSNDPYNVIAVAANTATINVATGSQTFTVANGTGNAISTATFTASVSAVNATANAVTSIPVLTSTGSYWTVPTVTSNQPTVGGALTTATFNLTVAPFKTLYTAAGNDAVVKAINITSTDTSARVLTLWVTDLTTNVNTLLGAINVPLSSGQTGSAATIDALGGTLIPSLPYDANGKRILPLKAGTKLSVSTPQTNITAGTLINVTAMVEEY